MLFSTIWNKIISLSIWNLKLVLPQGLIPHSIHGTSWIACFQQRSKYQAVLTHVGKWYFPFPMSLIERAMNAMNWPYIGLIWSITFVYEVNYRVIWRCSTLILDTTRLRKVPCNVLPPVTYVLVVGLPIIALPSNPASSGILWRPCNYISGMPLGVTATNNFRRKLLPRLCIISSGMFILCGLLAHSYELTPSGAAPITAWCANG